GKGFSWAIKHGKGLRTMRRPGATPKAPAPGRNSKMAARANFDVERLRAHYRTMARIRAFEEAAERAHQDGHVKGAVHLSIGQEAVASGVCMHLGREDLITTTHRGHGHTIAKGADTAAMLAELLGRASGTCQGKGGSL